MTVSCQACSRSFPVEARSGEAPSYVARCPGCGAPVIVRPALLSFSDPRAGEDLPVPKGWVENARGEAIVDLPAPVDPHANLPAPKHDAFANLPAPVDPNANLPAPKREAEANLPEPKEGVVDLPAPKSHSGPNRFAPPPPPPRGPPPPGAPRVFAPPPPLAAGAPPRPPIATMDLGGEVPGLDLLDDDLSGGPTRLDPLEGAPMQFGDPSGSGEVVDLPAPRGYRPGNTGPIPRFEEDEPELPAPRGPNSVRPRSPFLPPPPVLTPMGEEELTPLPPAMPSSQSEQPYDEAPLQLDLEDFGRARGESPGREDEELIDDDSDAPTPPLGVDPLSPRPAPTPIPPSAIAPVVLEGAVKPGAPSRAPSLPRIGRVLLVAGGLGVLGAGAAALVFTDVGELVGLSSKAKKERAARQVAAERLLRDDTVASYRKAAAQLHDLAEIDPKAFSAGALEAQAHLAVALLGAASEIKQADRRLTALDAAPPGDLQLVKARALRALADNKRDDARQALLAATQKDARDPAALVYLGWTDLLTGDAKSALSDFTRALAIDPDRAQALYGRGRAAEATGDTAGALDAYKKALAQSPQHFGAALGVERLGAGPAEESESRVQTLLSERATLAAPREVAEAWALLGHRSAVGGRLDEAEARFRKAIAIYPALVEAKVGLAEALCAMHRAAEALPLAEAAARAQPANPEALLALCQAQIEVGNHGADAAATLASLEKVADKARTAYWWGRLEESRPDGTSERAIERYRQALAADPRFVDASMALSRVLVKAGKSDEAAAALQQAELQASSDPVLRDRLGEAYLAAGKPDKAEAIFREVIKAAPGLVAARLDLGETEEKLGRFEQAQESYAALAASQKELPGLDERRGRVALALHHSADASALLTAALAADKSPSATLRTLAGEAALDSGKPAEARALFEQALSDNDRLAPAHLGLARSALADGHLDEAELESRRALTLAPSAAAHLALAQAEEALGHPLPARAEYLLAAKPSPGTPAEVTLEGRIGAVRILVHSGAVKDALAAAVVIAKEAPGRSEPAMLIGDCLDELGKRDKALKAYEAAVRLGPKSAEARWKLGRAEADAGRDHPAAKELDEALRLGGDHAPFSVEAWLLAGDLHRRLSERNAAVAAYKKYLALAPADATARKNVDLWLAQTLGAPADP